MQSQISQWCYSFRSVIFYFQPLHFQLCPQQINWNQQFILAYIPFEQHNIVEHSRVLLYYHPKRDLIGCKLRVLRGIHDANFRPDRVKIRIQRSHHLIQEKIEDWKSPPTPLKYNFNDY